MLFLAMLLPVHALAQTHALSLAVNPAVDDIVKAALVQWKKNNPRWRSKS
jgi:hypothetical protein